MPLTGAKSRLGANGTSPVLEISNPVGALMVRLAVRSLPPTRNAVALEALPSLAVKLPKLAVETVIAGLAAELTVPESATVWLSAPALASVMFPLTEPTDAVEAMRA